MTQFKDFKAISPFIKIFYTLTVFMMATALTVTWIYLLFGSDLISDSGGHMAIGILIMGLVSIGVICVAIDLLADKTIFKLLHRRGISKYPISTFSYIYGKYEVLEYPDGSTKVIERSHE